MPTARVGLAAAVVNNASGQPILYAIGGRNANGALRRVEAYNYVTNSWTRKADLPYAGAGTGRSGAVTIGTKVYVPGGGPDYRRLHVYNPSANTWATRASLPVSAFSGASAAFNGRLFVFISSADSSIGRRLYQYNPSTNTWTRRADPPNYHVDGIAGFIGGKLYVAGGAIPNLEEPWDDPSRVVDVYDPTTNRWTTREQSSRHYGAYCAAWATLQSQLYDIGGWLIGPDAESSAGVAAYSPATNSWVPKAGMQTSRCGAAAAKVVYGGAARLLVVGGEREEYLVPYAILRTMEMYTP